MHIPHIPHFRIAAAAALPIVWRGFELCALPLPKVGDFMPGLSFVSSFWSRSWASRQP
jgi:hypothetical protein